MPVAGLAFQHNHDRCFAVPISYFSSDQNEQALILTIPLCM